MSDTIVTLLERLGTLFGFHVLVVLPPYVVTRFHAIKGSQRMIPVSVRVRR